MVKFFWTFCILAISALQVQAAPAMDVKSAFDKAKSGEIVLVDIRDPSEWRQTGIGAHAHPISIHRRGFLQKLQVLQEANKDKPLAFICAHANRSRKVTNALPRYGFSNIYDVRPGMEAPGGWIKSGLPIRKWQPRR